MMKGPNVVGCIIRCGPDQVDELEEILVQLQKQYHERHDEAIGEAEAPPNVLGGEVVMRGREEEQELDA